MKSRCLVSVSGGATSALMAIILKQALLAHDVRFVFANTGCEDERTLAFVDRLDKEHALHLAWVEARVHTQKGCGTTAAVTSFENAARRGEPFEAVVAKYGLPGPKYPHCNRELKLAPIHDYARCVLGWPPSTYSTAIGIRADEIDRMSDGSKRRYGAVYPLVALGVTKEDVQAFWEAQPFRLELPEHRGNCVWCWKKSLRKLRTVAAETPEAFDFPARLEALYSTVGAPDAPRKMFRENRVVSDIRSLASESFDLFSDPAFEQSNGCGETCEVHADLEDDGWDLI
jgi:hypothetical protein